ncbi:MAG: hypothetical protein U5L72_09765 [Bacteroidales bacterium]|nr:hypothetical protein [Bacteroidales bacterium]
MTGREATGVKEVAREAEHLPEVRGLFTEFGTSLGASLPDGFISFEAEILRQ